MEYFKNLAVFGKDDEQNTIKTLLLLKSLGIRYKFIQFKDDRHEMSLRSKVCAKGDPIIMIDNKYIGDLDKFKKYVTTYYKYF